MSVRTLDLERGWIVRFNIDRSWKRKKHSLEDCGNVEKKSTKTKYLPAIFVVETMIRNMNKIRKKWGLCKARVGSPLLAKAIFETIGSEKLAPTAFN